MASFHTQMLTAHSSKLVPNARGRDDGHKGCLLKLFYDSVLMENMHHKQSTQAETPAHTRTHTREHHIKMQLN